MRVCIAPQYKGPDRADGGIRRVVDAMVKYLPDFDIQVTDDANNADIINCHGATLVEAPDTPMVASCHGLYWHDYDWASWAHDTNKRVNEVICRSQAVTAPSRWVANAIARGTLRYPHVIHHGIDAEDWEHNEASLNYVLWNKARTDAVSDPGDMQRVAAMLQDVPFVSTFGVISENVHVVGAQTHEDMKRLVQRAGVYLATARETFGVGTLEALASGVPVVGWRYGGQEEIVIEGETGYLAEHGNYEQLADCITRALSERVRLSANARADVLERWGWRDKIAQYAYIFNQAHLNWTREQPKVSVIVTCHNLAHYLIDALESVAAQTMHDYECIIIDDASTDNTEQVAKSWINKNTYNLHFRYEKLRDNHKLSGARNHGFQQSHGKYVLYLDADDMLTPNALDILSNALDNNSAIHIAAGHLDTVNDRGEERKRNPWPEHEYNWNKQMAHLNQLSYSSMIRRDVLDRSGGYRERDWRAEDASFLCNVTSRGFRAAKVTEETTLVYRMRGDSKSVQEGREHADRDGDWTAWYPWRTGAASGREGLEKYTHGARPKSSLVPWSAQGPLPTPLRFWPVRHHQRPLVSVIIPVGPGHERYLPDALDSLQAQTFVDWEAVVVQDTGTMLAIRDVLRHYPWARHVENNGKRGAGTSRNLGISDARAPLCLFLDADDVLVPTALEKMVNAYLSSGGKYVYCDCQSPEDPARLDGAMQIHPSEDYDQQLWVASGYEPNMPGRHSVTALVETEKLREVKGFDEKMEYWEDWDLYMKLAVAGVCGVRIPEPLLIYRLETGARRKDALKQQQKLRALLRERYEPYALGERDMAGCCGGGRATMVQAQNTMHSYENNAASNAFIPEPDKTEVRMRFVGEQRGAQSYAAQPTGRIYRGGNNPFDKYVNADPRDVEHLVSMGVWQVVQQPEVENLLLHESVESAMMAVSQ